MKTEIISEFFDVEHYSNIALKRKQLGLKTYEHFLNVGEEIECFLIGKKFINIQNGREVIVNSINKHYYNGYFLTINYSYVGENGKHIMFYENINCEDPFILKLISDSQKSWKRKIQF